MSDRNDDFTFDDENDLFGDNDQPFDIDNDDDLPDNFDDDMPRMEADDDRAPNRSFLVVAVLMIILFVFGLGAVLFLALRPTGPTEAELTATQIVLLNSTTIALAGETATQAAINAGATQTAQVFSIQLTQTALAASPTPSATLTRPATVTPTATIDATFQQQTFEAAIAGTQTQESLLGAANVLATQTALALSSLGDSPFITQTAQWQGFNATRTSQANIHNATNIAAGNDYFATESIILNDPDVALTATPDAPAATQTGQAVDFNGTEAFNVIVANATATAQFNEISATQTLGALGVVGASVPIVRAGSDSALVAQIDALYAMLTQQANDFDATVRAQAFGFLGTQTAEAIIPAAFLWQTTPGTPVVPLVIPSPSPEIVITASPSPTQTTTPIVNAVRTALANRYNATQTAQAGNFNVTLTAQSIDFFATQTERAIFPGATRTAEANPPIATQLASTLSAFATNVAAVNAQNATPTALANAANATLTAQAINAGPDAALTAQFEALALTQTALAFMPTMVVTSPLDVVNQTATAITGAFQTATAAAGGLGAPTLELIDTGTPVFVQPTALPDSGLFDDVAGGSSGTLLLVIVGSVLVFTVIGARALRSGSRREDEEQ